MPAMTKEEFKRRWESDDNGGGITFNDVADCAEAWGVCRTPRIHPINKVTDMVLKKAGVITEEDEETEAEEICNEIYDIFEDAERGDITWREALEQMREVLD